MSGAPFRDAVSILVLDSDRRIVESDADVFRVGDVVERSHGVRGAIVDAVEAAAAAQSPQRRTVCDGLRGTHWLVTASIAAGSPWRARVVVVDVTESVLSDRQAIFEKVIHSVQNASFALQSVVEAIHLDRPSGPRLDEYLAHAREPAVRLSTMMVKLGAILEVPMPALQPSTVDAIVERATSSTQLRCRPRFAATHVREARVEADVDMLAGALRAMLEGGGPRGEAVLDVEQADLDGVPHVRVVVERRSSGQDSDDVSLLWDVAGGRSLELPLEMAAGRAAVLAHGGSVSAERLPFGRVRLAIVLPLLTAD